MMLKDDLTIRREK